MPLYEFEIGTRILTVTAEGTDAEDARHKVDERCCSGEFDHEIEIDYISDGRRIG